MTLLEYQLHLCEASLTAATEGVYSCTMMNSSMMNQTMRVGVYFYGRSELHTLWVYQTVR